MAADLGHGLAEPLGVLLGDEHGDVEDASALYQRGDVLRDPIEIRDRRAKRLLDVDNDQYRPLAVEPQLLCLDPASRPEDRSGSSASLIAKRRARNATVPAATVISTLPLSFRSAKQLFSERLSYPVSPTFQVASRSTRQRFADEPVARVGAGRPKFVPPAVIRSTRRSRSIIPGSTRSV